MLKIIRFEYFWIFSWLAARYMFEIPVFCTNQTRRCSSIWSSLDFRFRNCYTFMPCVFENSLAMAASTWFEFKRKSSLCSLIPLPEGALCLMASAAFCGEYLLFYFHSTTHKGLEGYYHLLLVLLVGLCVLSTISGALLPTNFTVDLFSGIAMTLQGLWFYQTAFTLYGPMMPDGCQLKGNDILCRSVDSEIRGELLANFQLFILVLGVLGGVVGSYVFISSKDENSDVSSRYVVEAVHWGAPQGIRSESEVLSSILVSLMNSCSLMRRDIELIVSSFLCFFIAGFYSCKFWAHIIVRAI